MRDGGVLQDDTTPEEDRANNLESINFIVVRKGGEYVKDDRENNLGPPLVDQKMANHTIINIILNLQNLKDFDFYIKMD